MIVASMYFRIKISVALDDKFPIFELRVFGIENKVKTKKQMYPE
jgi:hypothetical protein